MPSKRVSDSKKTSVPKKQKLSTEIAGVLDAIAAAEHLTPEVKQMLSAGCPNSLGEFADNRHAYQNMIVSMIGEVFTDSKQNLESKVSTVEANISQMEIKKSEVVDSCKQADQSLQDKFRDMETVENELYALSDIMTSARTSLEEAKVSEMEGGKKLVELTSERLVLREALDMHLVAVLAGSIELLHVDALMLVASKLKVEETLCFSLPKVFAKASGERSSFDDLVLKELEKTLQVRIDELDAAIIEEQPGATHRAAVVVTADREAVDAITAHENKTLELETARKAHEQQLMCHGVAMQAECDVELQLAKEVKDRDVAKSELDAFVNFPCECFGLLEARVSKQPTPATVPTPDGEQSEAPAQSLEMPEDDCSGIVPPDSLTSQIERSCDTFATTSSPKVVEMHVAVQPNLLGA